MIACRFRGMSKRLLCSSSIARMANIRTSRHGSKDTSPSQRAFGDSEKCCLSFDDRDRPGWPAPGLDDTCLTDGRLGDHQPENHQNGSKRRKAEREPKPEDLMIPNR